MYIYIYILITGYTNNSSESWLYNGCIENPGTLWNQSCSQRPWPIVVSGALKTSARDPFWRQLRMVMHLINCSSYIFGLPF